MFNYIFISNCHILICHHYLFLQTAIFCTFSTANISVVAYFSGSQRLYRAESCRTHEIDLFKYYHMKWWGCIQFGSIGCGVSKAEGKWVETEKGKENDGSGLGQAPSWNHVGHHDVTPARSTN